MSLTLTAAVSATDATIQKKIWIRDDHTDNLKQRNERFY